MMTNATSGPILLTADDVRQALPMKEAVEAMRRGFAALSNGDATVPVRQHIRLDAFDGDALFMPAYAEGERAYAVKIASIHAGNNAKGLDAVQALVAYFDAETGRLTALLEGKSITAIRTGAGSGLATDLLARDDAKVAVIFGTGSQARTQLEAVCTVRAIKKAYCVGRRIDAAQQFALEMGAQLEIEVEGTIDASVARVADVICTATTASEPILALSDVSPGVHINAIGTHRPDAAEIDEGLIAASTIVVDQREGCMQEAGDILRAMKSGAISRDADVVEVGEIVLRKRPGRTSLSEITLFKSVGNAIQDLFAAQTAVHNAIRLDLGTRLRL